MYQTNQLVVHELLHWVGVHDEEAIQYVHDYPNFKKLWEDKDKDFSEKYLWTLDYYLTKLDKCTERLDRRFAKAQGYKSVKAWRKATFGGTMKKDA